MINKNVNYYKSVIYHNTLTMNDMLFILNETNTLITSEFINGIFTTYKLGVSVRNLDRYITAMTHTSYSLSSYEHDNKTGLHKIKEISTTKVNNPLSVIPLQKQSYERLEFLGDSVIHTIMTKYLFDRFIDQQEGFMTKLRTKLENSETLAQFTCKLGLNKYVLLSRYMEEKGCRYDSTPILEDIFEAFIGALFLDCDGKTQGYCACQKLVISLVEQEIDFSILLSNDTNYKDALLRYAHEQKMPDPMYGTIQILDMDNKIYEMYVKIGDETKGVGRGNSKKKGEQNAAMMALITFGVITEDDDESEDEYELICDDTDN